MWSPVRVRSLTSKSAGVLVDVDEVQVALADLGGGIGAIELAGQVRGDRLPPDRPAHRETGEPRNGGGRAKPVFDLRLVGAPTEDQATDAVSALAPAGGGDLLAVGAPLEPFNLPQGGLDAGVLEFDDGPADQLRSKLDVEAGAIVAQAVQLVGVRGHEEFEQELTVLGRKPVRQMPQPLDLARVHLPIAIGVEAYERLDELGVEARDVPRKILAVLELKLGLT